MAATQPRLALHQEALGYLKHDLADSTLGQYQQSLKYVVRVLLLLGLLPMLWAPQELVVCWVVAFFARSASYKTIVNYLKAWKYFLGVHGWDASVWQGWQLLPRLLRGVKRVKGDAAKPKLPITPALLLKFVRALPLGGPALALWAAILVGFFGFLRKGHLCVDGVGLGAVSMAVLRRKNFVFDHAAYCVHITVTMSKTNQFRQRQQVITIQGVKGHVLDPYAWLQKLFTLHPADGDAPAFGHVQGGVYVPLTYSRLLVGLKDLIKACGLDPSAYGGHSLRRGGATWAFQCGVHPLFIRIQGDWQSDTWLLYVGMSAAQKCAVTRMMQEKIASLPGAAI